MLFITGCDLIQEKGQKLVCTISENEYGRNVEQITSVTYKNDKLNHLTKEVNTNVNDSSLKSEWEKYRQYIVENYKEFSKKGISLKVEIDDQNYKYTTTLEVDFDKVSEEDIKEQGLEDLVENQSTIEDLKKLSEENGATCEIK